jgi:hypothetical protein
MTDDFIPYGRTQTVHIVLYRIVFVLHCIVHCIALDIVLHFTLIFPFLKQR